MNFRTGLKTLAVALPVALTPMKSTAQNVTKEAIAENVTKRIYKQYENLEKSLYKREPLYFKGDIGIGYGKDAFMNQGVAEAKAYGSIGLTNESLTASVEAAVGKKSQSYGVRVGAPFKSKSGKFNGDVGMLFRQQNNGSSVPGILLESEVAEAKGSCVEKFTGTAFWGAYFRPSYKIAPKATIHADLEGGMVGVTNGITGSSTVNGERVKEMVANGNVVNRSHIAAGAKIGVGADYEVAKNLKIGGDYNYSTYDKNSGFNVKATYNFRTKDMHGTQRTTNK